MKVTASLLILSICTAQMAREKTPDFPLVAQGALVEKLAGNFKFTEGPASDKDGNIYFTDIPNDRIMCWDLEKGISVFKERSGGANGLMFNPEGELLICEGKGRRLVKQDPGGMVKVLAGSFEDLRLNSPNDLWIDPLGGIYFSDPRYGNREGMEQDGEHVYYLAPGAPGLSRVAGDLVRPNGVLGTPDGKYLYIADHGDNKTFRYRIQADGSLSEKSLFAGKGSDGMTMDERGNLYLTGEKVLIYAPDGKLLDSIAVPERPSNLCFGGPLGRTLFITARTSFYSVEMNVGAASEKIGKWASIAYKGSFDPRHETSFVNFQGKFYMIGGRESRMIDCYDPETNSWSRMKAESPLIHHYQPVVWDDKIYMVGAMTGNYPKEPPMTHIQIYDPLEDRWTEGGKIPEQRRRGGSGTVVYKNKIYVACGIELGHTSGTNCWFDQYDPKKNRWKQLADAPHRRDHFHAVVLDDKLYCIGGRTSDYHEEGNFAAFFKAVVREVDVYDFKTGKWSTLDSKLPVGTAAGGVAVQNGKILYFGGETAGTAEDLCWLLDPENESWTRMAHLKQGRHGSQAVVYEGKVYIASGSPNRGGGKTPSMEVFTMH